MLLLDLIDKDYFRASFPEGGKHNGGWDCDEEKDVEEDKNDEKSVNPQRCPDGDNLIIRVGII